MKKVLLISSQPFFQWRGSPIRVGFNVQSLAELGYEVDLLTLPIGHDLEIPGVRVIRVPNVFFARNVKIGPSPIKAAFDVLLLFAALGLGFKYRYDVIHGIEDAGAMGVMVAKLTGSRFVFEKHSDPASYRRGPLRNFVLYLYTKVERFTARRADACIGTGPGLVNQIQAMRTGKEVHHIFDIPSSRVEASGEQCDRVRNRLSKHRREKLITYVGSFAVYQGVDLMFAAIPAVVRQRPEARFIIIGGTEAEIAERRKALGDRKVRRAVTFLGKIPPDELPPYLSASDILLSPRLAGINTPLKLLDYLKAGRAVVATNTEANRLILDETTSVLVDPSPEAFAAGIRLLLADDALRARLGRKGSRLITEKYNFDEFKKRLARCYEDVLDTAEAAA
jgi:glycosyltransferase involved in cell wall biosynthesis